MRRKKILLFSSIAIILAIILPIAIALSLGYRHTTQQAELHLYQQATLSAQQLDQLFGEITKKLDRIKSVNCHNQKFIYELRRLTLDMPTVWGVGIASSKGKYLCSNLGLVSSPLTIKLPPLGPELRLIRETNIKGLDRKILLFAKKAPDNKVFLLGILPKALSPYLSNEYGHSGFSSLMSLSDHQHFYVNGQFSHVKKLHQLSGYGGDAMLFHSSYWDGVSRTMVGIRLHNLHDIAISKAYTDAWSLKHWKKQAFFSIILGIITSILLILAIVKLTQNKLSLKSSINYALSNESFQILYMPVYDLNSDKPIGAEALIRWNDPIAGMIMPDYFIPLAEKTGQIIKMTDWLLENIANDLAALLRQHQDLHIAINLSPQHFQNHDIVEKTVSLLAENDINLDQVIYEVTERSLIEENAGISAQVMKNLRQLGCKLALDDFGTGYSSLSYLSRFCFDYVKIDKQFTGAIGTDAITAGLVETIIAMSQKIHCQVIAEGVETAQQLDYLKNHHVAYAQGWHYSKPLNKNDFINLIEASAKK